MPSTSAPRGRPRAAAAVQRRDHRRALAAEERVDVVEHLVAPPPAEVEVDVGAVLRAGFRKRSKISR
jgi:hypothetical protein